MGRCAPLFNWVSAPQSCLAIRLLKSRPIIETILSLIAIFKSLASIKPMQTRKPKNTTTEAPIVVKQHFVPVAYLRRFTNAQGMLERSEIETGKVLSLAKAPSSECVIPFFYGEETGVKDEISQQVESFWQELEDSVSKHLDDIERAIVTYQSLPEEYVYVLAVLGTMLWMRTPHLRETINKSYAKFDKELNQRMASYPQYTKNIIRALKETGEEASQERAEKIRQEILQGDFKKTYDNSMHLSLIEDFKGYNNMFFGAKWRFYIAAGSRQFITTSAPCIEVFPKIKNFYGPTFYERKHLFPLSPKVMCEIQAPWLPGKRVKRSSVNDDEVLAYNMQHGNWSHVPGQHSRCYASRKKELEELEVLHNKQRKL